MPQPLSGYRVADFSHVMAGPFCSHFLRVLGAEVARYSHAVKIAHGFGIATA